MPFPRCKGQAYEYSNHIPLAIKWPWGINGSRRIIEDYVTFTDIAPTILEAARISQERSGMQAITGASMFDIFSSIKSGQINPRRNFALVGKERHDVVDQTTEAIQFEES